jgi:hypothetical protein
MSKGKAYDAPTPRPETIVNWLKDDSVAGSVGKLACRLQARGP